MQPHLDLRTSQTILEGHVFIRYVSYAASYSRYAPSQAQAGARRQMLRGA